MDSSLENDDVKNFALHLLNDDCLLELYKYLRLSDAQNLAETSKRLKHLFMFRYHKMTFEFHSDMFNKTSKNGKQVLDNILSQYGQYLRSWSLTINNPEHQRRSTENVVANQVNDECAGVEVLKIVSKYCTNLKRLELKGFIHGFERFLRDCGDAAVCLANVEILIFDFCLEVMPLEFLQCFRKLKHLYFKVSGTTTKDLQIMFQNNPGIESYYNNGSDSFCGDSHNFGRFTSSEFSLCEFGPNFQKLCLGACCDSLVMGQFEKMCPCCDSPDIGNMLRLATINLTSLKLEFWTKENLTLFLTELAKKGVLKELELQRVSLCRDACNTIQLFSNLELVVLCPKNEPSLKFKMDKTFIWPPKLKRLRSDIEITDAGFFALMRQLKFLTHLQLDSFRIGGGCMKQMNQVFTQRHRGRPTLYILHDGKPQVISNSC